MGVDVVLRHRLAEGVRVGAEALTLALALELKE